MREKSLSVADRIGLSLEHSQTGENLFEQDLMQG